MKRAAMKMTTIKKIKYLALVTCILALAACQQPETLESSVNNRWKGITGNDLDMAYGYVSPGYKKVENLDSFKLRIATAQINIKWVKGTFKEAQCANENVCEVTVEVEYNYTFTKRSSGAMEGLRTEVKEDWIKVENNWYFVPEKK